MKIIKGKFEILLALFGFIGMLFNMNAILLVVISGLSGVINTLVRKKEEKR